MGRVEPEIAAAHGWPYPLDDEEILRRLLKLNAQHAALSGGAALPASNSDEDEE